MRPILFFLPSHLSPRCFYFFSLSSVIFGLILGKKKKLAAGFLPFFLCQTAVIFFCYVFKNPALTNILKYTSFPFLKLFGLLLVISESEWRGEYFYQFVMTHNILGSNATNEFDKKEIRFHLRKKFVTFAKRIPLLQRSVLKRPNVK